MNRAFTIVIDGKAQPAEGRRLLGDSMRFSRDGKNHLYATRPGQRNDDERLVWNGREIAGLAPVGFQKTTTEGSSFAEFSPDGQSIAWWAQAKDGSDRRQGLAVNDQLVALTPNFMRRPTFTPDSRHVLWVTRESKPGETPQFQLYVDGRPALRYAPSFELEPATWGMRADGTLQFLAIDGDVVKRHRVSADSETNLASMAADFAAAEQAELARIEKEKSDAVAVAEEAKAAKAEADAKAKADYEAARAANAKARADAAEA